MILLLFIYILDNYHPCIFLNIKHIESELKQQKEQQQCSLMMYSIHQTTDYAYKLSYLAGVANYNLHTAGCRRKDCNILNLKLIVNCKY